MSFVSNRSEPPGVACKTIHLMSQPSGTLEL
jgi:hypothetical protein